MPIARRAQCVPLQGDAVAVAGHHGKHRGKAFADQQAGAGQGRAADFSGYPPPPRRPAWTAQGSELLHGVGPPVRAQDSARDHQPVECQDSPSLLFVVVIEGIHFLGDRCALRPRARRAWGWRAGRPEACVICSRRMGDPACELGTVCGWGFPRLSAGPAGGAGQVEEQQTPASHPISSRMEGGSPARRAQRWLPSSSGSCPPRTPPRKHVGAGLEGFRTCRLKTPGVRGDEHFAHRDSHWNPERWSRAGQPSWASGGAAQLEQMKAVTVTAVAAGLVSCMATPNSTGYSE